MEWALESLNISIPERVREDLFSQSGKWDPNPDATVSLVQDWGVISLYKKFLCDWHMIIERNNKSKECKKPGSPKKGGKKTKEVPKASPLVLNST